LDVGVAMVAVQGADRLQIFQQLGAIEVLPWLRAHHHPQVAATVDRFDLRASCTALVHAKLADLVTRAFVDGDRDFDAVAVGVSMMRGVLMLTERKPRS